MVGWHKEARWEYDGENYSAKIQTIISRTIKNEMTSDLKKVFLCETSSRPLKCEVEQKSLENGVKIVTEEFAACI